MNRILIAKIVLWYFFINFIGSIGMVLGKHGEKSKVKTYGGFDIIWFIIQSSLIAYILFWSGLF